MNLPSKTLVCLLFIALIFSSCSKKYHPQSLQPQEFSIQENSVSGTLVGKVLTLDEENDTSMTYSIIGGNTNNAFQISGSGGVITVLNENALDFETNPKFLLTVEVKDIHNVTFNGKITINLVDVIPPTDGLLVYYPFDDNVTDLSGNMNNCYDYTTDNFVPGKWGSGLDFNGITDYLKLFYTLNSTDGLTFSFWLKSRGANGVQNHGAIVAKYNMTAVLRCFMIYSFGARETRSDNRLSAAFYKYSDDATLHDMTKSYWEPAELLIYPTDPSYWTIINPRRIEIGTWTHCVVNMTPDALEIWLDGVLCTKKRREYTSYFDSPNEPVYIGNNVAIGDGSNNHFNGVLDELRVYNRALSTDEIKTLFKEQ